MCWSAAEGTLAFSTRIELKLVAAARPPRGRRLSLRQFPRGDERRAAHRAAQADRGRIDRPHHDRARARDPDVPADAGQVRARDAGSRSCWSSSARTTRKTNLRLLRQLKDLMGDLGFGWDKSGGKWGGVVEVLNAGLQAAITEVRTSGLNIMMSMKEEGKAGLLRRGLRGAARASRRLHRAADATVREARHARHLVRACRLRLPARAADPQSAAGQRRACHARDRRRGLRHGARIQGLAFRRARRRAGALGIQRADVRLAAGARLRGGEGPLRSARALSIRARWCARPSSTTARCSATRPAIAARTIKTQLDWSAYPGRRRRFPGRGRDVQQQRRLPQIGRRRDVPELSRHPRRARRHARPRQYAAARRHRPARARTRSPPTRWPRRSSFASPARPAGANARPASTWRA